MMPASERASGVAEDERDEASGVEENKRESKTICGKCWTTSKRSRRLWRRRGNSTSLARILLVEKGDEVAVVMA